ncbi:MAG: flagellar export chaperone FlgN [Nocardioides alkalitolerans]
MDQLIEEVAVDRLSLVLWRERELLDTLLYRVELEQLVLTSGNARWLARATQDVAAALATLGETELLRAVVADEAAAALGLAPHPSLRALAAHSDEPWATILAEHRDALVALTGTIAERADASRDLIAAGHRAARDALLAATAGGRASVEVDAGGDRQASASPDTARFVDLQVREAAFGSALGVSARVVRASLADFLR